MADSEERPPEAVQQPEAHAEPDTTTADETAVAEEPQPPQEDTVEDEAEQPEGEQQPGTEDGGDEDDDATETDAREGAGAEGGGDNATLRGSEQTPSVVIEQSRSRSDSRSTVATQSGQQRSTPLSSAVFVITALDTIAASKEARKSKELEDAVKQAQANIKQSDHHPIDPESIFLPLQLASKTDSIPLQVTALDCIGKLITYSYFAFPSVPDGSESADQPPLIERAIETICDCFENEHTAIEIQQQIIKSLLAAVLNDKIVVHGAGLLKAVRQIYNIFIYSKSAQNQQIAQGSLTQMIGTVYDRVRMRLDLKEVRIQETETRENRNGSTVDSPPNAAEDGAVTDVEGQSDIGSSNVVDQPVAKEPTEKLTLQSFETNKDDTMVNDSAPTMVTRAKVVRKTSKSGEELDPAADEEDEIYIKDAFLVFRALCKLSHKVLTHEQQQDLKAQNMRSKLLSLHLMQHLLNNHIAVFTSPIATIRHGSNSDESMTLLQAIKPHLCLSLSRNGASSVPRVFNVCCEIFWLMLKHMRVMLKLQKELEVFFKEIYLAILEKRSSPIFQKQSFMHILERLSGDPRALVEIYLNYDCDRTALENLFQGIIEQLSRMSSMPVSVTASQQQQYEQQHSKAPSTPNDWHNRGTLPPSLTTAKIDQTPPPTNNQHYPPEYAMKQNALECLVEILRSLDIWSSQDSEPKSLGRGLMSRSSVDVSRDSMDTSQGGPIIPSPRVDNADSDTGASSPVPEDDPNEIEKVKQRKIALTNAIRTFNFKPKRGMKILLSEGFIPSNSPTDIAHFIFRNDRLDKATLGEYLGEGDAENIAVMHAFVDCMDFTKRRFPDALRDFLQSFRLPGESQKIDRFMLKFAQRYVTQNPNAFASADAAYVLAYSVILLNTDLHSTKMKGRRMTKDDFIKNNKGINDNADLPVEYLSGIYDEILNNEIVLRTERETAANLGHLPAPQPGLASRAGQALATVGRDIQGEKYAQASEEISSKTEQLYRSLIRAQRKSAMKEALSRFIPATSVRHVGSMFNVTWMSFLSGLSAQVQDTQNRETIRLCMDGIRLAIRISCMFDLETPRVAFVTALAKFTNLGNLREMAAKNVEALKVLLDVAITEGDHLQSSWREILTCISQLDRFQLLTDGVDEGSLPDVSRASPSTDSRSQKSLQVPKKPRPRSGNGLASFRRDVAIESRSAEMVRGVDMIFTNTANLKQEALVDFVRALNAVSWQEIQSSGQSESPRTYSLQKLVEISYYNMTRVRIEWSKIWEVLGEHFNHVGCNANTAVVFFALDSLRQLSMRFMEIEELPGFKFQKDFLKPFEHVMANSTAVNVKDMVLRCLIQMIQARGDNIRSGWKTMFRVFSVAASEPYEGIVNMAFEHVTQIYKTRFGVVVSQGAFADLVVCLTEFSKNLKFQKKSLQAIETLKSTIPKMLKTPECPLSHRRTNSGSSQGEVVALAAGQSPEEQFWYPLLIAFQDVLMTGDDLEVRSRALTYLFETLIRYGGDFPPAFWDVLWRQLLYPIFVVLQSKSEMSKVPNHEELSVWLSTTMIQALRNMITLFTHYFDSLEYMLDRFLGLLTLCICQENDTIARIGSNCLQQLILQNVIKFTPEHWEKIVGAFVELFERTTAYELFTAATTAPGMAPERRNIEEATSQADPGSPSAKPDRGQESTRPSEDGDETHQAQLPAASSELEDYRPQPDLQQPPTVVTAARRRFFNRIIINCVLQILMIETVNELFSNDAVYSQIPSKELLRLMALLKKSYQFAKKFNGAKDLRLKLWKQGFMKQPPNLLNQESGSAATYINILFRMYHDEREERKNSRLETEDALIPRYVQLDEESQQRNITAWRPVVVDVVEGYTGFPLETFEKYIETFYPITVDLLSRDLNVEIRLAIQALLRRVGECRLGITPQTPITSPTSPRSSTSHSHFNGRRQSVGR
ncbi:hypothetical protein TRV_05013 [Trichophyton verrucosum HKI 0517]|uniref:SEC7 domain-containing protein n=1 Tax=Trichophyton verrucosum (strain HKI 0517) TaxID=663202 RepID=D4DD07_TRIVH|nr:uncharacterized protein TRV_05013 [Trichophyton verrucosum HKI 0517]EFE40257.1 hypothetical protein TRV_05013 [Trichophyton verrucosum HKI 0517]